MRVAFYHSQKEWCVGFAAAFGLGVMEAGDVCYGYDLSEPIDPKADIICLLGAGYKSTFDRVLAAPQPIVFLDKGWFRAKDFTPDGAYFHMSVGAYRPSRYAGKWGRPPDRRLRFGWNFKPWRSTRNMGHILLAWSSFKYHEFHGLPLPHEHAEQVVRELRKYTDRDIVYRQKPNQPRHEVPGALVSREGATLVEDLRGAHVLITVASSACLEAMLAGVPSIILGDALLTPVSSSSLDYVNYPYLAHDDQRIQILNDLAYCQWHLDEYAKGTAWQHVRQLALNRGYVDDEGQKQATAR